MAVKTRRAGAQEQNTRQEQDGKTIRRLQLGPDCPSFTFLTFSYRLVTGHTQRVKNQNLMETSKAVHIATSGHTFTFHISIDELQKGNLWKNEKDDVCFNFHSFGHLNVPT